MIDLKTIPEEPGVYLMKDHEGTIIYIGKAKNLKKRVSSYFDQNRKDFKTQILVSHIQDLQFIVTQSEEEAFLLENNLIKKNQPRYNIQLKDSKSYPYLAIDNNQAYPPIYKTRENPRAGVRYFGPFAQAETAASMIKIGWKYFHLRTCRTRISKDTSRSASKACMYFHIGKCPGYCLKHYPEPEYTARLKFFEKFLNGRYSQLEKDLNQEMNHLSQQLEFEKAGEIRDLLFHIQAIKSRQKVYLNEIIDIDVFASYQGSEKIFIALLFFREGRLLGKRIFKLDKIQEQTLLWSEVLLQFYKENPYPDKILAPITPEEKTMIQEQIELNDGISVKLTSGSKEEQHLLQLAIQNARFEYLSQEKITQKEEALGELQKILNLPVLPRRIEAYDIATIEGYWSVGASVSFFNGRPDKNNYRHFRIKTVIGQDDYAMLREVMSRRLKLENTVLPDLFVIDGGKGQLNSVLDILIDENIKIPVIGLAKKEEELFIPHRQESVKLAKNHPSLQILTSMRDEVHRFANRLHNKIRSARFKSSKLENITGIGPQKRKALLRHFHTLKNIQSAAPEELMKIAKIKAILAMKIKETLS